MQSIWYDFYTSNVPDHKGVTKNRLRIIALEDDESVQTNFTKTLVNCISAVSFKSDEASSAGTGVSKYMDNL